MTASTSGTRSRWLIVGLSVLFVPLWASGFVGGKLATSAEPVPPVLLGRFVIAAVVMGSLALLARARRPRGAEWGHLLVVAMLLQVGQFGFVYTGLAHGVPAGVSSLIMGMAPLCVALFAPLLFPERLTALKVLGLLLGALGVYIVLSGDLADLGSPVDLLWTFLGMVALTSGTLYQKRYGGDLDVRTTVAVQMCFSAVVASVVLLVVGGSWLPTSTQGWLAVTWLGVANSAAAFALMFVMLRLVSTVHISALLNLVPATVALASVPILGEPLSGRFVVGLLVAIVGLYVGLVVAQRRIDRADTARRRHVDAEEGDRDLVAGASPPRG